MVGRHWHSSIIRAYRGRMQSHGEEIVTAIAMWKETFGAGKSVARMPAQHSVARMPLVQGLSGERALNRTLGILRNPSPIHFSDAPDHDFIGLLNFYDVAMSSLSATLSSHLEASALRAIARAMQTSRQHRLHSFRQWRENTPLYASWVLDGASVRLRFAHAQLAHHLAELPKETIDRTYTYLAAGMASCLAGLAHAALDLCRDTRTRSLAALLKQDMDLELAELQGWLRLSIGESGSGAAS